MRKIVLNYGLFLIMGILLCPSSVFADVETTVSVPEVCWVNVLDDSLYCEATIADFLAIVAPIYSWEGYPNLIDPQPESDDKDKDYGWTQCPMSSDYEIWSNASDGWQLQIMGSSDKFSGGDGNKPVTDIVWIDGWPQAHYWHQLSDSNAGVVREVYDPYTNPVEGDIDFSVLLRWDLDPPGTYVYESVVLTAVAL